MIASRVSEIITAKKLRDDALFNVADHIKRMYILIGIPSSKIPDQLEFDFLLRSYKTAFAKYSLKEIEYAFELAVNGTINYDLKLYDSSFSVVYVSGLMKKYAEWKRNEFDFKKATQKALPEISEADKFAKMKASSLKAFDDFKAGDVSGVGFYIYNFLNDLGIIDPSPEKKHSAIREAEKNRRSELNANKGYVSNRRFKELTESFENTDSLTVNRAKEINLRQFFSDLIEMDDELINHFK